MESSQTLLTILHIMELKLCTAFSLFVLLSTLHAQQKVKWQHLSTVNGDIPLPWKSVQQTGAIVGDLDNDGINDFVITCRLKAPAAVWYQRTANGWVKHIIDTVMITVEAGGSLYDIDNDGDLDLVFGGDYQSNELWWWENPYPDLNRNWKRHLIKKGGSTQHHDQVTGKFRHTNAAQVIFWNQGEKTLYMADIPADPFKSPWAYKAIYVANALDEKHGSYVEGLTTGDVDGDGYDDIIAGNHWFKYDVAKDTFNPVKCADAAGRVAAGKFKPGKFPQIIVSPGDGEGSVKYYECMGNPEDSAAWIGRDLIGRKFIHGHTLQIADINNDGNLDIFVAEMAKWTESLKVPNNPNAEAYILYGDGKGNFKKQLFKKGYDFHEGRVADLDGDGDMDILGNLITCKLHA